MKGNMTNKNKQLAKAVNQFFSFLDATEESDEGRIFHPIRIDCCRCLMSEPLGKVLGEMKSLAKELTKE
jgi:hypothetical protein